jgi:hypothetical protein
VPRAAHLNTSDARTEVTSRGGRPHDTIGAVIDVLPPALAGVAGLAVLWILVLLIRNRSIDNLAFWILAVLEVGVLVLGVAGVIGLVRTTRHVSGPIFVAYLLATPLILPAAVLWGLAERNRSGTAVVLVGVVAIPALMLRIHMIWTGTG